MIPVSVCLSCWSILIHPRSRPKMKWCCSSSWSPRHVNLWPPHVIYRYVQWMWNDSHDMRDLSHCLLWVILHKVQSTVLLQPIVCRVGDKNCGVVPRMQQNGRSSPFVVKAHRRAIGQLPRQLASTGRKMEWQPLEKDDHSISIGILQRVPWL